MQLNQFIWSKNPRGMHVKRVLVTPLHVERWTNAGFGWVKLVAAEYEYVDDAMTFLTKGVTPIVRIYRERWGSRGMDAPMRDQFLAYLRAGVKWFEFYNEPNLGIEWQGGVDIDWRNTALIKPLMDNWLAWAEFIVSNGGYPGFIALAESDDPKASSVRWMDTFLSYMAQNHFDRFRNVLASGAYCATHPYILNHWYQEVPGGGNRSARSADQVNAREGGWHFEYPYDPIQQAADPGRTVYGGTALTPYGDPVGLLAMGRMFNERCAQLFGTQAIPVVGTEGGIYPFLPNDQGRYYQQDNRYPAYDENSQAEGTIAMFEWSAHPAPPWFFGVCLWKEDDYFEPENVRAITRLAETPVVLKNVPAMEVMSDGSAPLLLGPDGKPLPGPGPIHGQADFHMIILGPGLDEMWFFQAVQPYWNRFRPIVTTNVDLVDYIQSDKSLAVTVLAPPQSVEELTERIALRYPFVWFDLIIADEAQTIADTLNNRVRRDLRFG